MDSHGWRQVLVAMVRAFTLLAVAVRYIESTPLCADYATRLKKRAIALQCHCGADDLESLLTEPNVNKFLCSLSGLSPRTIRSYREDCLTLWNFAADLDLVRYPIARRIRRDELPELLIECFSVDEARALLNYARNLWGVYPNGVPRKLYWPAAILLDWDTGFRRGDLWRFNMDAVRPDNTLRIIQHKTRQLAEVQLRASTIEALDAIGKRQPLAWTLTQGFFGRHFKKIVNGSGVKRGTFKWLRRASGSYVEAQQPGAGHKHLGHKTPGIFTKHYDARLGGYNLPQPPEL